MCRFDRIESNRQHFQPTLNSSGALYFLSLAQIDFRHNESTAGETILSIRSNRQHFQFILHSPGAQIDFRYDDSTLGETTRVYSIKEGSRMDFRLVESQILKTNRL